MPRKYSGGTVPTDADNDIRETTRLEIAKKNLTITTTPKTAVPYRYLLKEDEDESWRE